MLLDVRVTTAGNVSCVDGCMQPASLAFFLAEGREDAQLADDMARQGRGFAKRLPPAATPGEIAATADFVLLDGPDDRGVAMLLVRPDGLVPRSAMAALTLERLLDGLATWAWDPSRGSPCPALPTPHAMAVRGLQRPPGAAV